MLYVPGYGEASISISSDPSKAELIGHTVRFVGNVTNAISRLSPGNQLSLRGPFGTPWPVEQHKGYDVVIAAGGIGLAPLRPVLVPSRVAAITRSIRLRVAALAAVRDLVLRRRSHRLGFHGTNGT